MTFVLRWVVLLLHALVVDMGAAPLSLPVSDPDATTHPPALTLWVHPTLGSDHATGQSRGAPLRTLGAAAEKLRVTLSEQPLRDVFVELAPGSHRVPANGLILTPAHSPSSTNHTVVWRGSGRDGDRTSTRVHGGVPVTGWTAPSARSSLPEGALVAPAPAALKGKRSRQFYVGGRRAARTRVTIGTPVGNSVAPHNPLGLQYNDDGNVSSSEAGYNATSMLPLNWSNPGDIEFGYLPFGGVSATWEEKRCSCKSISKRASGVQIALKQPCLWNLLQRGQSRAIPSYVENVREHLQHPGQFYYDVAKAEVIYMPLPGEDMSELEAFIPVEETLIHHDGSSRHTWEGVTFEYATWLRPAEGPGDVEIQAAGAMEAPVGVDGTAPPAGAVRCPPIVSEGQSLTLGCPSGATIDQVIFASFGTPTGNCKHGYVKGECDDVNSTVAVSALCFGKQNCTVLAKAETFGGGDPCDGTGKTFAAQIHCTGDPPPPPLCSTYNTRTDCAAPRCGWNTTSGRCAVAPFRELYKQDIYTAVTPGNVVVTGGSDIRFVNSTFQHLGAYASSARGGSQRISWEGCTFSDTSAGAISLGDLDHCNEAQPGKWDGNFTICDSKMANLPVEFSGSTAIFGGYVGSVRIEHNHVANTSYTGISLGWGWGHTGCRQSGDNHIIRNRLENPGRVRCCDGGAMYTLGPQPGSSIEGNLIRNTLPIPDELGTGGAPPNAVYHDNGSGGWKDMHNVIVGQFMSMCGFNPTGGLYGLDKRGFSPRLCPGRDGQQADCHIHFVDNWAKGKFFAGQDTGGAGGAAFWGVNVTNNTILGPDVPLPAAAQAVADAAGPRY
jgi:hypothetical protein